MYRFRCFSAWITGFDLFEGKPNKIVGRGYGCVFALNAVIMKALIGDIVGFLIGLI